MFCECAQPVSGEIRYDLVNLEAQVEHDLMVFNRAFYDCYSYLYTARQ